jgi:hypothetical protein
VEVLKHKFWGVGSQKIERSEWILKDHHSGYILDLTKPWKKVVKVSIPSGSSPRFQVG